MSNGIDWFRWHHGSVTDPKFLPVARRAGASLPEVLAVWAFMLEQASAAAVRGEFGQIDTESLDCLFGFELADRRTANILAAMEVSRLTENGRIVRWEERQVKREREGEKSTGRVREHRSRQASMGGVSSDETPRNATQRQETPREEESREEKNTDSGSAYSAYDAQEPANQAPAAPPLADEGFAPPREAPLPMREQPPLSDDPAVQLSVALRRLGVSANSVHPDVQDWARRNVSLAIITEAVGIARERKKGNIPPAYLRPIVDELLNPPKPRGAPWWESDEGVAAKAAELGLAARPGESPQAFKGRIRSAIDGKPDPPAAPSRIIAPAPLGPKGVKPEGLDLKSLVKRMPEVTQ